MQFLAHRARRRLRPHPSATRQRAAVRRSPPSGECARRRLRRFGAAGLAIAIVAVAGAAPALARPSTPVSERTVIRALAGTGVAVYRDETARRPLARPRVRRGHPSFGLTHFTLSNLVAEANSGGGLRGATLDAMAAMPQRAPPLSFLVAGWVAKGRSQAARTARRLMGPRNWKRAPKLVFPSLVVTMFTADLARSVPPTRRPRGAMHAAVRARAAADGPCGAIDDFVQRTFAWVFDSLKIDGSKLPRNVVGDIARTIASWWNYAVDLVRNTTKAVVQKITAPLLGVLRQALGTYALVTQIVGYLTPSHLAVTSLDKQFFPFGIIGEPPVTGALVAFADPTPPGWPPALVECARALDVTLPTSTAVGTTVKFDVTQSPARLLDFGQAEPLLAALDDDFRAQIPFQTGQEDRDTAENGREETGTVSVVASAERKDVADLKALAQSFVNGGLTDAAVAALGQQLGEAVGKQIQGLLSPFLSKLLNDAGNKLNALARIHGETRVLVTYHVPPEKKKQRPKRPKPPRPTPLPDPLDLLARAADVHGGHDDVPISVSPSDPVVAPLLARNMVVVAAANGFGIGGHRFGASGSLFVFRRVQDARTVYDLYATNTAADAESTGIDGSYGDEQSAFLRVCHVNQPCQCAAFPKCEAPHDQTLGADVVVRDGRFVWAWSVTALSGVFPDRSRALQLLAPIAAAQKRRLDAAGA